jgi:acylphosphatase
MVKGAVKLTVKGTVQSTFFRTFCKENADKLNLKGIVRTLENGDVEIIVEGEKSKIEEFFQIVKQGPKYSQIRSVTVEERKWTGDLKEFKVLRF